MSQMTGARSKRRLQRPGRMPEYIYQKYRINQMHKMYQMYPKAGCYHYVTWYISVHLDYLVYFSGFFLQHFAIFMMLVFHLCPISQITYAEIMCSSRFNGMVRIFVVFLQLKPGFCCVFVTNQERTVRFPYISSNVKSL